MLRPYSTKNSGKILFSSLISAYSIRPKADSQLDDSMFRLIITETELFIKPSMIDAFTERKCNLLHKIPLKNIISYYIKPMNKYFSTLHLIFIASNQEEMEIAIVTKVNSTIQNILQNQISKINSNQKGNEI